MKLSWTLVLKEKTLQTELNRRLSLLQKPFIHLGLVVGIFVFLGILINSIINNRQENPDLHSSDSFGVIGILVLIGWSVLMLQVPEYSSLLVLLFRCILCICICYVNYSQFSGKEMCDEPTDIQIKHFKSVFEIRQSIIN